jgi:hypothetical protein
MAVTVTRQLGSNIDSKEGGVTGKKHTQHGESELDRSYEVDVAETKREA